MDAMEVDVEERDEHIDEARSSDEEIHWRFSQVKGVIDSDEQPTDGMFDFNILLFMLNILIAVDLISCVEFSDVRYKMIGVRETFFSCRTANSLLRATEREES